MIIIIIHIFHGLYFLRQQKRQRPQWFLLYVFEADVCLGSLHPCWGQRGTVGRVLDSTELKGSSGRVASTKHASPGCGLPWRTAKVPEDPVDPADSGPTRAALSRAVC